MQIVIDIPKEQYNMIKSDLYNTFPAEMKKWGLEAIRNGVPLPEGHGRKFEEIMVEYPPAELCTYPEYTGKPYFSIKYEENGEHIIGFGTYNPKVFSMYLREYFIAPTIIEAIEIIKCDDISNRRGDMGKEAEQMAIKALEQEPCEDAISRQAAIDAVSIDNLHPGIVGALKSILAELPPVTPQPKMRRWVYTGDYITEGMLKCSECGFEHDVSERFSYCPNCGIKMQEVENKN